MTSFMHKPSVSGQSIVDRALAAKYTVSGSGVAKVVCKATTEEVMGPKRKHLDYLLHCTNDSNVSIPQLANHLIDRTHNSSWVVVYKALVTIHHLMNYGNERFTQYLASNNCHLNLANFTDRGSNLGYSMSVFIRRYARYLNQKASSYRLMAFDFCKVKRGKDDGLLRTMNTEKLLKALPVCHNQLEALVEFEVDVNDLNNGVINGCFMLMFKDLIRLFACYNDGIINLLEKYFDMNKKQCKDALDVYKKFLARTDRVCVFLKVAENVGIDKGDIPDLAKAPSSLLEALEQHLASLENTKKSSTTLSTTASAAPPPKPAAGVSAAISSYRAEALRGAAPGAGASLSDISDQERAQILEEEQRQLDLMRQRRQQQQPESITAASRQLSAAAPASSSSVLTSQQPTAAMPPSINDVPQSFIDFADSYDFSLSKKPDDFFSLESSVPPLASSSSTSLATLNGFSAFDSSGMNGNAFAANNPFLAGSTTSGMSVAAPTASDAGFPWNNAVSNYDIMGSARPGMSTQAIDLFGGMSSSGSQPMLQPIATIPAAGVGGLTAGPSLLSPARTISSAPMSPTNSAASLTGMGGVNGRNDKLIKSNDIDSSLANLAGNLTVKSNYIKKSEHQWKGDVGEKKMTGGPAAASAAGGGSGWAAGITPPPPQPAAVYWNQTPAAYPPMQPVYPMMGGGMALQPVVGLPPAGPYAVPMGGAGMMLVPQQPQAATSAAWSQQQQLSANDPFGAL